ncbi:hypothetical protein RDABS01_020690 [Bienertia sinuspersici]
MKLLRLLSFTLTGCC